MLTPEMDEIGKHQTLDKKVVIIKNKCNEVSKNIQSERFGVECEEVRASTYHPSC